MTVLHNEDRWEPSNATVEAGVVTRYDKGAPGMTHLDYGMLAFRRDGIRAVPDRRDLRPRSGASSLVAAGRSPRTRSTERFHDIGTPEALADTEAWFGGTSGSATASDALRGS